MYESDLCLVITESGVHRARIRWKCGQDETYLTSVPIALNGMVWMLSWLTARPARRQFETASSIDRDVVVLHGETHSAVTMLHRCWSYLLSSVGGGRIVVRGRGRCTRDIGLGGLSTG
jgi:hypothetical protein